MGKCKHYKTCKLYEKNGYTCNHESEAETYCGKRKELNQVKNKDKSGFGVGY